MDELLRYRRILTPKVFTIPCEKRMPAYIPTIFGGVGSKPPLTVARVETRLAHPKEMPVVTATARAVSSMTKSQQ